MLNKGRDYIEVSEVLESMRCYLYIEQFRYGEIDGYEFDVNPEVRDCLILNLIVQPVVENAVIHGIGDEGHGGVIYIRARHDPPVIRFRIKDSGRGMSPEKLAVVRRSIRTAGHSDASGLRNVHRRLQLFYGEEYGREISSEPDGGTAVEIVIPVLTGDPDTRSASSPRSS